MLLVGVASRTRRGLDHHVGGREGVIGGRLPRRHTDPHRRAAGPLRRTAPDPTITLYFGEQQLGGLGIVEANEHLVQHDVVEDQESGISQAIGDRGCRVGCLSHHVGNARAAQCSQHRPHLDLAGALRRLGRVVHRFETIVRREISGDRRKRSPKRPRTSDDRDAAVVGDVEPLVTVGGPRVRSVQALDEIGAARIGERPQTERTIDVEPTVARRHPVGDLVERVEGAGVHLTGLSADQHGNTVGNVEREIAGAHPALVVGRHDRHPFTPESDQAERLAQGAVGLLADHDVDLRRTEQPVALHVPSVFVEQRVAGGRETTGVGHGRSGHERDVAVAVETQHVECPAPGDVVDRRGHGRHHRQRGVLVPCVDEERRTQRHRIGGSVDEPEVVGPGRAHRRRSTDAVKQFDRLRRVRRTVGKRFVERGQGCHRFRGRRGGTAVDRRCVGDRMVRGGANEIDVGLGGHRRLSWRILGPNKNSIQG